MKKKLLVLVLGFMIGVGLFSQFFPFAELLYNYDIPVYARNSVNSVSPDYILDAGDTTESGVKEEYRAYSNWINNLEGKTFAIQGGHDREHRRGDPYGTGFFSECSFKSPTRVLKMGNLVFLLVSEDRYYYNKEHIWLHHHTPQLHEWIKNKIGKYSIENNNIFIIEHCPLHNTVAWSDGKWWATGEKPWVRSSKRLKKTLENYENHVVAHISGHIHTKDSWRDIPKDKVKYGYGDGNQGIENVGHFVNGNLKVSLPDIYFLNPQALCYTHGSATSLESSSIYYFDLLDEENKFIIKTKNIKTEKITRTYPVSTQYPINLADGEMRFIESKTTIRSKTNTTILENKWLKVNEDSAVVFHKKWNTPVDNTSIRIEPENISFTTKYLKKENNKTNIKVDFQEKAEINNVTILPNYSKQFKINGTADNRRIVLLTDIHFDTPKDGHEFGGVKIDIARRILDRIPLVNHQKILDKIPRRSQVIIRKILDKILLANKSI